MTISVNLDRIRIITVGDLGSEQGTELLPDGGIGVGGLAELKFTGGGTTTSGEIELGGDAAICVCLDPPPELVVSSPYISGEVVAHRTAGGLLSIPVQPPPRLILSSRSFNMISPAPTDISGEAGAKIIFQGGPIDVERSLKISPPRMQLSSGAVIGDYDKLIIQDTPPRINFRSGANVPGPVTITYQGGYAIFALPRPTLRLASGAIPSYIARIFPDPANLKFRSNPLVDEPILGARVYSSPAPIVRLRSNPTVAVANSIDITAPPELKLRSEITIVRGIEIAPNFYIMAENTALWKFDGDLREEFSGKELEPDFYMPVREPLVNWDFKNIHTPDKGHLVLKPHDDFTESESFVIEDYGNELFYPTEDLSVFFWFRSEDSFAEWPYVFDGTGFIISFDDSDGITMGIAHEFGGWPTPPPVMKLWSLGKPGLMADDRQWHQTGFTFHSGEFHVYLDGQEITNPNKIFDDDFGSIIPYNPFFRFAINDGYFYGGIDHAFMTDYVFTSGEVLSMYNAFLPIKGDSPKQHTVSMGIMDEKLIKFLSNTSVGNNINQNLSVNFTIGVMQKLQLSVGYHLKYAQKIMDILSRGDHTQALQNIITILPNEIKQAQTLFGELADSITKVHNVQLMLARGDRTGKLQNLSSTIMDEVKHIQSALNILSDSVNKSQSTLNILSRGDNVSKLQSTLLGIFDEKKHVITLLNSLTDFIHKYQKNLGVLSGDPVSLANSIQTILNEVDYVQVMQALISDNLQPQIVHSVEAEVYLDSRPLSHRGISFDIVCSEDSVHNQLTFSSSDEELFEWCDPEYLKGSVRLIATIGNRTLLFVLDEREGERNDFKVTGYSPSIVYEQPYNQSGAFQLTEAKLASEIADELCLVDWQASDWTVPEDFNFEGVPLDGVQALSSQIGAVLRAKDDGSLKVRKRFPVRPVDIQSTTFDVEYDRDVILTLSPSTKQESGYNAVEVIGKKYDVFLPTLELETPDDGDLLQGDTATFRVFWNGVTPNVDNTYVTDGILAIEGGGSFYYEDVQETVEFKNGTGSVNYNIHELLGYEWIGDNKGTISEVSNELFIENDGFGVAEVTYRIRFQRYSVSLSNVPILIAVLYMQFKADVQVKVRTVDEPIYGSSITAEYLTDTFIAVERGTAWIDNNKYKEEHITIEVPYHDDAVDGAIAHITDPMIAAQGNYHIVTSSIRIDGPKVTNILELKKCLI